MKEYKAMENSNGKIIMLCIVISIAIFILDSIIPLGVAGGVPYIIVVLISLWSPKKELPYYMAVWVSVLNILGFYSSPPGGELWKVIFNRSLALFAIWTTAVLSVQRKNIQEEKERALDEINILQGIIPICSYCHNIHSDKGSWDKLEEYIDKHSEASFSHGICPECMEKAYSDAGLDLDGKQSQ